MSTDSSSGADTALALAEALRGARAGLTTTRLTPLAERRAREVARYEAHGAQLTELSRRALMMRARIEDLGIALPELDDAPPQARATPAPALQAQAAQAPPAQAPPIEETLPPRDAAEDTSEETGDADTADEAPLPPLAPLTREDTDVIENLGLPLQELESEEPELIEEFDDAVLLDEEEDDDDPDTVEDEPILIEAEASPDDLGPDEPVPGDEDVAVELSAEEEGLEVLAEEEPADEEPADEEPADEEPADEEPADGEPADEEPESDEDAEIMAQLLAEEAALADERAAQELADEELAREAAAQVEEEPEELDPLMAELMAEEAALAAEAEAEEAALFADGDAPANWAAPVQEEPEELDPLMAELMAEEAALAEEATAEQVRIDDEALELVDGEEASEPPSAAQAAAGQGFTREMLMEMLGDEPAPVVASLDGQGDEEATLLMSSADVRRALAEGELEAASARPRHGHATVTLEDLAEVGLDDLDSEGDEDLLLEDDEGLDELSEEDWSTRDSGGASLVDDYGQAILPTIRDHRDPRPSAAAIRITPKGAGVTGTPVGLEYLEEVKVALGPADDDDYDLGEEGGGLYIEAHDADEYEDEEEPEVPMLTPDDQMLDAEPLELSDADIHVVDEVSGDQLKGFFDRANHALESGDLQSAVTAYSDLLDLDPVNVDAFLGRGRCNLDLGDYAAAMSDFQKAEDMDPNGPEPLVAMGELFFARKDYARAIEFFDHAIELDSSHAMARCRRGISYYYKKSYRQAFLDLQKAYTLDPDIPNIKKYVQMAIKKLERSGEA